MNLAWKSVDEELADLLQSAKIVIFYDDDAIARRPSKPMVSKSLSFNLNLNSNTTIDHIDEQQNEARLKASSTTRAKTPCSIAKPSRTDSLKRSLITYDNQLIDIRKLFKLYGVARENISIIKVNELQNGKQMRWLFQNIFFKDTEIKYPIVFIHGIFFGSDEEMNLAHNEGYLYELFRDTGLFNSLTSVSDSSVRDEKQSQARLNDYDSFVIDEVAKSNRSSSAHKKPSNSISSPVSRLTKQYSFKTEYSSLCSINKDIYCENYVKSLKPGTLVGQQGGSLNDHQRNRQKLGGASKSKVEFEELPITNSRAKLSKPTPPGQVLEIINKRFEQVPIAIEKRNEKMVSKVRSELYM